MTCAFYAVHLTAVRAHGIFLFWPQGSFQSRPSATVTFGGKYFCVLSSSIVLSGLLLLHVLSSCLFLCLFIILSLFYFCPCLKSFLEFCTTRQINKKLHLEIVIEFLGAKMTESCGLENSKCTARV